ncbi:MAG TPA: hypothetical protein VM223_09815, partial [Planctomycetota bacterium]|nr:hypothetical protein [Planctomycetota bacterium]
MDKDLKITRRSLLNSAVLLAAAQSTPPSAAFALVALLCMASSSVFGQTAKTQVQSNVVTVTCVSPAVPASPISNVNGVVTVACQIAAPVNPLPVVSITASSASVVAGTRVNLNYSASGSGVNRAIY